LSSVGSGTVEWRGVLSAGVQLLGSVALLSVSIDRQAGADLVGMVPLLVVLSLAARWVQSRGVRRAWARGHRLRRAVLIGSSEAVAADCRRLAAETDHGIMAVGACLTGSPRDLGGIPVGCLPESIDEITELHSMVGATAADLVVVLPSAGIAGDELRRLAWRLESIGVELLLCAGIIETVRHRVTIRSVGHAPLFHVSPARLSGPSRLMKGAFDRIGAAVGLIVAGPLLILVAVAIWSTDGATPFFCQTRIGRGGRPFRILKFRTMVVDAEELKAELLGLNESDGALFKIAGDPRTTPIGKVLRRYSIDELPQLINVLRGEMSLVGPRPPLPEEVAAYSPDMLRRLLVKPGMTGLWQVSGRSTLSWAQTEILDLRYVENWSLAFDLMILARTARAVIGGSGAC
jgi:exopolysaccharide biosynthesis polyprenyl glycosylphosphotransferase